MSNTDLSYVRTEFSDSLPPPSTQVGVIGWMRANLFSSVFNTVLTLFGIYLIYLLVPPLIQFALVDATWEGDGRESCLANHGACWAYVDAYFSQFIYGRYPDPERWRVDIVFASGILLLVPMLIPKVPFKRENAILLLGVYPVLAFVLLTGGNLDLDGFLLPDAVMAPSTLKFWVDFLIIAAAAVGLTKVITRMAESESNAPAIAIAVIFALIAVVMVVIDIDFGMRTVETDKWGGLLVTLVVAITGITASLPLGILLALGRRSKLPAVRLSSVIFIEFWRGVPLITVLFMSSVMLPLFLPEGVTFDKLLRALIGVALFSAAYMAEVVRGGLQAIPKGQHEGAQALGLTYWQMMGLIVLPQALKLVIPGIVNSFIALFKDTTLVLIIGLFDLLGQVQSSFTDPKWSTPFTSHTGYLFAALIFWVFCFSMSRYSIFMEKRLHTGHKR
ncbi:MAG: amino acid ABC transporter permease [Hyphomicrobiales bacterium]|nr:MAG: amino acid ABC transporter permease [Hyphomicrobiales bacterium]